LIESFNSRMNESLLDVLAKQNKVTANNIANVDTPYYKVKTVAFQEELKRQLDRRSGSELALRRTHEKHLPMNDLSMPAVPYQIVESNDTTVNNNLNNVDIDYEMSHLAKNQLLYNVTVERVSGHYAKYKKLLANLK
jgi:flagellar basal-body rod protein FlgB